MKVIKQFIRKRTRNQYADAIGLRQFKKRLFWHMVRGVGCVGRVWGEGSFVKALLVPEFLNVRKLLRGAFVARGQINLTECSRV